MRPTKNHLKRIFCLKNSKYIKKIVVNLTKILLDVISNDSLWLDNEITFSVSQTTCVEISQKMCHFFN